MSIGKFKIALVGVKSDSAKAFLSDIFYSKTAKIVAVCDESREALKEICQSYMVNGYRTYDDMMENEEIDFTIITIEKAA